MASPASRVDATRWVRSEDASLFGVDGRRAVPVRRSGRFSDVEQRQTKRWTGCRLTNRCSRLATKPQRPGASC
jgi:hypothetical protein